MGFYASLVSRMHQLVAPRTQHRPIDETNRWGMKNLRPFSWKLWLLHPTKSLEDAIIRNSPIGWASGTVGPNSFTNFGSHLKHEFSIIFNIIYIPSFGWFYIYNYYNCILYIYMHIKYDMYNIHALGYTYIPVRWRMSPVGWLQSHKVGTSDS